MSFLTIAGTEVPLPNYARPELAFGVTTNGGTLTPGATFTYSVSGNFVEVVTAVFGIFQTSATVANRVVLVQITDASGVEVASTPPPSQQAASLTITYSFLASATQAYGPVGSTTIVPLPIVALYPGAKVQLTVANIQVDDQLKNVAVTSIRVPTGSVGPEPVTEPLVATPVTL